MEEYKVLIVVVFIIVVSLLMFSDLMGGLKSIIKFFFIRYVIFEKVKNVI